MPTLGHLAISKRALAAAALLVAVVTAAYLPLRHNDFVNYDDDRLILDNPTLRQWSPGSLGELLGLQLFTPHYKPLVHFTWAVELRLFGPDPWAFHRHNLLLHLLNTLLVFLLTARLARPPGQPSAAARLVGPWIVAALWALHPMKVESVAWAAERKDVLFAAGYLGAMLAYLAWVDRRRWGWLALSALFALASVLSKGTAITLPAALLLIDLVRRRHWSPRLLADKLPHLAVALLALYLYGFLPGPGEAGTALHLLAGDDPMPRLVAAAHRHLAFAGHWLAPIDLSILYPVPAFLGRPGWSRLAGYLAVHLALAALVLLLLRRNRWAAAAALFFPLTLLPTLVAPISTTNYLSDRYTYLPSLGLVALIALAGAAARRRRPAAFSWLAVLGLLALGICTLLSHRQIRVWRDSERLFTHALAVRSPHPYAFNNRGAARRARGDDEAALADFESALELDPDYAAALANRGNLLRRKGRTAEALEDLRRAVALEPDHAALYILRGLALADLGRYPAAIADYGRALELDPRNAEAFYLRSLAHRRAGDSAAALADVESALAAPTPPTSQAYLLRARLRAENSDLPGALEDTDRALALAPRNVVALNNRGFLRLRLGDASAALADLERALELRPGYPLALRNRGDALAALQRPAEACRSWREAAARGAPATVPRLAGCP